MEPEAQNGPVAPELPQPVSGEGLVVPERPAPPAEVGVQAEPAGAPVAPALPTALPVTPPPAVVSAMPAVPATDNQGLTADDSDVIEKEWVDQAESIINQTKTDPHAEEDQLDELERDYLKKRFGRDVPTPDDKP